MAQEAMPSGLFWRLPLARAILAWERLWPALWPLAALVLAFLSIACFDLLSALPGWLHLAILVLFGLGFCAALYLAARRFAWPDRRAALRRLEADSGLDHRPLSALEDRFAGSADDQFGRLVWQVHRERLAASITRLSLTAPQASLVRQDPRALRVLLTLVLLIALISAGGDAGRLIARAVMPRFESGVPVPPPSLDLWLTPPGYTGLPPIYLDGRMSAQGPIAVPAGSTALAEVHLAAGDQGRPVLTLGTESHPFQPLDADDFKASLGLGRSGRLSVSLGGGTLAAYDLSILPDRPPHAAWRRPVSATLHGALRIDYAAGDDYGVTGLRLEIKPLLPGRLGKPLALDLPVPSPAEKTIDDTAFEDLTADPRAGLPVMLQLIATDAAGQSGSAPALRVVLPERQFRDPVARAVIALRKRLTLAPQDAGLVAHGLSDLSIRPDLFRNDMVVFLGLRVAARDLLSGGGDAAVADAQALMWRIATRLEDGAASGAESDLRAAQQALQQALAAGAPDAEIEKRMQDVEQALQRYLQALQNQGQGGAPTAPSNGPTRTVSQQDIQNMLHRAEELARTGNREAARAAFQQLQALLEALKAGGSGSASAAGEQALQAMGSIARHQQNLLDRSYSMSNGQQGSSGSEAAEAAGEQEALRRQLDSLRHGAGESPALDAAGQAMGEASKALRRGDTGAALAAQGQAMDALRQAAGDLERSMEQAGTAPGGTSAGQDPFGRNITDSRDIDIADPAALQESRRILDELRRRAGEGDRPQDERNYIERLLQDF
jgi:uncharacterized protein (TIGR02302 family)